MRDEPKEQNFHDMSVPEKILHVQDLWDEIAIGEHALRPRGCLRGSRVSLRRKEPVTRKQIDQSESPEPGAGVGQERSPAAIFGPLHMQIVPLMGLAGAVPAG